MKRNSGFTVFELLASICIVIILAGLLVSGITSAREKSQKTQCINNQRSLIQAVLMFALDEEHLPTALAKLDETNYFSPEAAPSGSGCAYASDIAHYYDNLQSITKCPKVDGTIFSETPVYSYGMNESIKGASYHYVKKPEDMLVLADCDQPYFSSKDELAVRHGKGSVVSFLDGHVEWVREYDDVLVEAGEPPSQIEEVFDILDGSVVISYASTTTIVPLTAQYSSGFNSWYDIYVSMEITTPEGEIISYDVVDPESAGLSGDMTPEEISALCWESPEFAADSNINIISTAKYWTKEWQKIDGRWQRVWVQKTRSQVNTNDDLDSQVWVLKDGDPVPDIPGYGDQISIAEAVQQYVVTGDDGKDYMSLDSNEIVYFFELSNTDPSSSGFDGNDCVLLMSIDITEYEVPADGTDGESEGEAEEDQGDDAGNDSGGDDADQGGWS